ncbi:general stress protein [Lederbergia lenta]|uniref:Heat induced stress protein YflT n=2 Tax=Lederbergia lenta TaxID=1467 RepID=A0A2X4ZGC3_LEDLE|nr:general stress protein [Lederbergia lenta]MCM3109712.1 general stress protein [Lederbergia lenta]MEC2324537.1 general stress protein [Lederbergia lenta]SQI59504.1 Heat induced stress protein YflT [Lederbergia lenta]
MAAKVIGVFDSEREVINAIKQYQADGLDPNHFSVMARDEEKTEYIHEKTDVEEMEPVNEGAFGIIGGFLAGIGGGLYVPGMATPGVGPYIAAGPLASTFSGGSYEELKKMFTNLGLDEHSADNYIEELNEGKIILFLEE